MKTKAALYEIDGYDEVLITTSDLDDILSGFDIEEDLGPGTYSIHIMGKRESNTGTYNFYYRAR